MNKKQLQDSITHIETIHSKTFTLTELRWFKANQKGLVKICEHSIKEAEDKIKSEKKSLKEYKAKFKAYDRIVKQLEKVKEKEKNGN